MNDSKKLSLAARYRPQTFADVAGQDMVKVVLSRACAEDRPACAYLFSGTRGVGKTTVARIFAKALNCANAPTAEPCNSCPQCQRIMQGSHVDVVEIDGASNNKVDDIRTLRETVGYAPMEGRYKVFIIDEAHMLTSSAFNALLKTLEEPPPRVIFIMATTEAHKFPVTIISRCQHFTFRHLNEDELDTHLRGILQKESLDYEEEAVRLIARRAQGSVRDSMSLLDQTLALGNERLTVAVTRDVLGLAGQEFFERLFAAMSSGDCASVVEGAQAILRRGVDIGFFIRELAGYFRNLFLLQQGGAALADILQISPGERKLLSSLQNKLSAAHLHAAWQMVLDSHRSVVQSTEPASALELLLLNLALLPKLLPIDNIARESPGFSPPPLSSSQERAGSPERQAASGPGAAEPKSAEAKAVPRTQKDVRPGALGVKAEVASSRSTYQSSSQSSFAPSLSPSTYSSSTPSSSSVSSAAMVADLSDIGYEAKDIVCGPTPSEGRAGAFSKPSARVPEQSLEASHEASLDAPSATRLRVPADEESSDDESEDDGDLGAAEAVQDISLDWSAFCDSCFKAGAESVPFAEKDMRSFAVASFGMQVQIRPQYQMQYDRIVQSLPFFQRNLRRFLGIDTLRVDVLEPQTLPTDSELAAEVVKREEIQACVSVFGAVLEHCRKR